MAPTDRTDPVRTAPAARRSPAVRAVHVAVSLGGRRVLRDLTFSVPAGTPGLRRQVGYTTQSAAVYGDLTVRANARYFAALQGVSGRAADRAVAEVGLAAERDQRVGTLSGGQRARVSLACALVARPRVLVLDEPTVGLDPVLRRELWARFHALADHGTTLLVSSHVMDEAARCDRLLLLRAGRLLADDTPAGLLGRTGADDLDEAFLRMVRTVATPSGTG